MKVHIALVTDKVFVAKLWEAFKPRTFGNWVTHYGIEGGHVEFEK